MTRLANWEIQTIEAIAQEAYRKLDSKEYVNQPERFVEKRIAEIQALVSGTDSESKRERRRLITQAQRLGIGNAHPPKAGERQVEPYEVATKTIAGRWARLVALLFQEPFDSDWRLLFDDVVTQQVTRARASGKEWAIEHGGIGQLELLETEALEMGLIEGDAKPVAGKDVVDLIAGAIG